MATSQLLHLPLNPMDHIPGPNYAAAVFYFGMKDGVSQAEVFAHLQEGLHRTFLQVPWLNGKLHLQSKDTPGWRPGQLEIRYCPISLASPKPYQLRLNELVSTYSYDDIKSSGFPLNLFKDEDLLWKSIAGDVAAGTEVLIAQANFIPGACLLAYSINHSACDATGSATVFKLWAENCRSIDSQIPGPALQDASWDRTVLDTVWTQEHKTKQPATDISATTWRMVDLQPPLAETNQLPTQQSSTIPIAGGMKSTMFYISPRAFDALRKACSDELGPTDISGNDILMALIWRTLYKARTSNLKGIEPDSLIEIVVVVDSRPNFSRSMSLPQDYIGNAFFHHWPALPLRTLIAPETTTAAVAKVIRASARTISHQSLLEAYGLLRDCPDYGLVDRAKPNRLLISPMLTASADFEFGATGLFTNGGRPECCRYMTSTRDRLCAPVCFMMPRKKSGGMEIMINLFEDELDFLMKDEEFGRYLLLLA